MCYNVLILVVLPSTSHQIGVCEYPLTGVEMNLSKTTRQAIAVTEALLRDLFLYSFSDYTYEIKPVGEPGKGSDFSRNRAYQVCYRNFEVKIRRDGDPVAFVEITLIESFRPEYGWQTMVDFTDSHSLCGSETFAGKLREGVWKLRSTHRIAYSDCHSDILTWDPYRMM